MMYLHSSVTRRITVILIVCFALLQQETDDDVKIELNVFIFNCQKLFVTNN